MRKNAPQLSRRDLKAIREFGKASRRARRRGRRGRAIVSAPQPEIYDAAAFRTPDRGAWRTFRLLCWKYRHQLAPVFAIGAVWIAGAILHVATHGERLAVIMAALGLAGAWLPGRYWLTRRIERAYATACVLGAGGWLFAAADLGAWRPTAAILWPLGCALAAPWWHHYRIRGVPAQPRADRVQVWSDRIARKALPGSALADVTDVKHGWAATIELPPGEAESDHAVKATALITSAYRLPVGSVSVEADPMDASRAKLLVVVHNPLHQALPWPGPSLDPATGVATIGLYADGEPVSYRFFRFGSGSVHGLVSGSTDSGKSTLLDQLAAQVAHAGLSVVWVIDPKMGQSLPNWIEHADWYALGVEEGKQLLRAATRIGTARNRHLAGLRWIDEQGRERRGKSFFDPTPDMPEIRIFIDEAQDVLADDECRRMVDWLTQKGRSVGFGVILGTQVPSIEQLGGSMVIRSQVTSGNVVVFRVGSGDRLSGRMVVDLPVEPWKLPKELPNGETAAGMGYTAARTVAMRSYLPEDGYHWASTAPGTELDLLSIAAAGKEYADRDERREAILTGGEVAEPIVPGPLPDPAPTGKKSVTAVLDALPADGTEIERGQVIKRSGCSIRSVSNALRELVEAGRVVQTGHGRYRRAGS